MKNTIKKMPFGRAMTFAALTAVFILMINYSEEAKKGMSEAISLCFTVIIPSLFPMLILSSFAGESRCPHFLQKIFSFPLRKIFGLSAECTMPMLLALTGGYPLAAKTATRSKLAGNINEEDAKRLTMFFMSPGVPFAVTVTGMGYFGSKFTGITLLFSCIFADILCAAVYNIFAKNTEKTHTNENEPSGIAERLVNSVTNASRSMLSVCAWIGLFGTALAITAALLGKNTTDKISLFAEITSAVKITSNSGDLPLTAFCLAFGGVCIFFQIMSDINLNNVGALRFIAARSACGGIAYVTESFLITHIKTAVPSAARLGGFYLAGNSAAGSAALMFACAVFMCELTGRPVCGHRMNNKTAALQYH